MAVAVLAFGLNAGAEDHDYGPVYGAARALSLTGDRTAARRDYARLLTIGAAADRPVRPELVARNPTVRWS